VRRVEANFEHVAWGWILPLSRDDSALKKDCNGEAGARIAGLDAAPCYARARMNRRPFFAVAALALVACAKPDPPKLTPLSAKVTSISPLGIDVALRLEAENPNRSDLTARSVTATITLDGRYVLGTVTVPHALNLPAHQKTTIDVPVSSRWQDLSGLVSLAAAGKDIPYKVDGTVELGGDLLSIPVPFHLGGTVTREQLTQATLKSLPKIPGLLPGAR
jgi:LEA14-like dessication related protein